MFQGKYFDKYIDFFIEVQISSMIFYKHQFKMPENDFQSNGRLKLKLNIIVPIWYVIIFSSLLIFIKRPLHLGESRVDIFSFRIDSLFVDLCQLLVPYKSNLKLLE